MFLVSFNYVIFMLSRIMDFMHYTYSNIKYSDYTSQYEKNILFIYLKLNLIHKIHCIAS